MAGVVRCLPAPIAIHGSKACFERFPLAPASTTRISSSCRTLPAGEAPNEGWTARNWWTGFRAPWPIAGMFVRPPRSGIAFAEVDCCRLPEWRHGPSCLVRARNGLGPALPAGSCEPLVARNTGTEGIQWQQFSSPPSCFDPASPGARATMSPEGAIGRYTWFSGVADLPSTVPPPMWPNLQIFWRASPTMSRWTFWWPESNLLDPRRRHSRWSSFGCARLLI